MRSAVFLAVVATLSLSGVTAQDFNDDDDYPSACRSVCDPIVSRSDSCDDQFNDDSDELTCICTGPNMANLIPQCRACIAQNNGDSDDLEDIDELLNACNFPITTTTPTGRAAATPSVTVYTTTTRDNDDDDWETETITSTLSGGGAAPTVFTTTSTGDNGDLQTDTITSTPAPSATHTTLVTRSDASGTTSVETVTGAAASGDTSTSGNMAIATAAPCVGAGLGFVLAALGAL